ncbi:MAG: DUF4976 domain-containing protein [Rhizobacter sp.]|nr:DUF4976 domain-containing protein [Ferruginibacter sp.]
MLTSKEQQLPRKYLYYHYYEYAKDHTVIPHLAIRSDQYKLIYFYTVNELELYDHKKDPGQQKNLYGKSQQKKNIQLLKGALNKLRNQHEDHEQAGVLLETALLVRLLKNGFNNWHKYGRSYTIPKVFFVVNNPTWLI